MLHITFGQIVVDGHDVNASSGQGVQVDWQRGCQRLAFTGTHLRDLAVVQRHPTKKLDIEVAHLHDPLGSFANHRKSLRQNSVQCFSSRNTTFQLLRFTAKLRVVKPLQLRLHRVNAINSLAVLLEQAVIATAEYFGEEIGSHACRTVRRAGDSPLTTEIPKKCWIQVETPLQITTVAMTLCAMALPAILPLQGPRRWQYSLSSYVRLDSNPLPSCQKLPGILLNAPNENLEMKMGPS